MLKFLFNTLKQKFNKRAAVRASHKALTASQQHGLVLCNIACGSTYHNDWINLDYNGNFNPVIPWNLHEGIPLPDSSADAIYCSHAIEHFDQPGATRLLKECFRTLKPSGILRLATPDLEALVKLYLFYLQRAINGDSQAQARYNWIILELLDQLTRHYSGGEMLKHWSLPEIPEEDFIVERVGREFLTARQHLQGAPQRQHPTKSILSVGKFRLGGEPHLWLYDRYSLQTLLEQNGFVSVQQCTATESSIIGFNKYGLDADENNSAHKPDSFYMEAQKK